MKSTMISSAAVSNLLEYVRLFKEARTLARSAKEYSVRDELRIELCSTDTWYVWSELESTFFREFKGVQHFTLGGNQLTKNDIVDKHSGAVDHGIATKLLGSTGLDPRTLARRRWFSVMKNVWPSEFACSSISA